MTGTKKTLADINKIVVFGDSVTFGMSASSQEKCWANLSVAMLEKFKGQKIELLNRGISASILCRETPAYQFAVNPCGLERLHQDVISENPDMVIIAYGLNDSRGGTSTSIFRRDYQKMIDQLQSKINPMIVMLNLYYMHKEFYHTCENWNHSNYEITEEFNLIIRQLAGKNGLMFADVYSAQRGVDWAVSDDHCHPNDLGHQLIAARVFETVAQNCPF